MTERRTPVTETCRAVKYGAVDLWCSQERGHDEPQDGKPGTWHRAVFTNRSEIDYPGAHHVIEQTETVTWEPADAYAEAVRRALASRRRPAPGGGALSPGALASGPDPFAPAEELDDDTGNAIPDTERGDL